MKYIRLIWLIAMLTQLGFMIKWFIEGKLGWERSLPLLLLISTMPFTKPKDFFIFRKKKELNNQSNY